MLSGNPLIQIGYIVLFIFMLSKSTLRSIHLYLWNNLCTLDFNKGTVADVRLFYRLSLWLIFRCLLHAIKKSQVNTFETDCISFCFCHQVFSSEPLLRVVQHSPAGLSVFSLPSTPGCWPGRWGVTWRTLWSLWRACKKNLLKSLWIKTSSQPAITLHSDLL